MTRIQQDVRPPAIDGFRAATLADAASITALVNEAYAPAEAFLYDGARIEEAEVRGLLAEGSFLLACAADGSLRGCVYVKASPEPAYLGLLAVRPGDQHRGLARALLAEAERYCGGRGRQALELTVVNHREALLIFYSRAGYAQAGERTFERDGLKRPSHLVVMRKPLYSK